MTSTNLEYLPYKGESSKDRHAYERYLADVKRGKSLLQLNAVSAEMTPYIRQNWSSRSFGAVSTPDGEFDALICNVSYHFYSHGQNYGNILLLTLRAKQYFQKHRQDAVDNGHGLLRLPNGSLYEKDGRIVTYVG